MGCEKCKILDFLVGLYLIDHQRVKAWVEQGMENLYFFVHQNLEKESPVLSAHFAHKLNEEFGLDLTIPVGQDEESLFK